MRVLLQRVKGAQVEVDSKILGRIQKGLLLYVGIDRNDTAAQAEWLAAKIATLRVFQDEHGRLNLHAAQVGGAVLAVPNFTLMGDARRGRRPSFSSAAAHRKAREIFAYFVDRMRQTGLSIQTGCFGVHMDVLNIADGPVNLELDSPPPAAAPAPGEPSAPVLPAGADPPTEQAGQPGKSGTAAH